MKRAVARHEQSALAIQYLLLKELNESGDSYATQDITSFTETANLSLEKSDHVEFQRTIKKFEEYLTSREFGTLVERGCKKRANNKVLCIFRFISEW